MGRLRLSAALTDWRIALMGATLLALFYVALPVVPAEILFQVVAWGSVMVFAINARRNPALGMPWVLIGIGWASFAFGDLLFTLYDHVFDVEPFLSPADLFYVAGYPFLAVGLASLVRRGRPDGDRIALIDAGIILVPAVVVAWVYLIEPNAVESSSTLLERAVSAAYAAGDVLCLAVLLRLVVGPVMTRRACHPALTLLLIGFTTMFAADAWFAAAELYGGYAAGGWNDAMYIVPYVVLAAAATHPSMAHIGDPLPHSDPSLGPRRLALLAFAALVSPAILIVQWLGHKQLAVPLIVLGTAVSFLLVVARMASIVDALELSRAKLAYDVTHDSLTGLPNRALFVRRLEELLDSGDAGALLFVDLDRFKQINDRFGHQAGDDVLTAVAVRMSQTLRDTDHVSRLAGDEFAIVLPGVSQTKAYFMAERLLQQLRFEVPIDPMGAVAVSASVGMVMWDRGHRPGTAMQLLNEADRAMYVAKAGNGDQLATNVAFTSN